MYSDFQVKIPDSHSGISQKTIRGTTYVYYSYSRKYDPVKKYTVARNTSIGKIEDPDSGLMIPNQNFFRFFPETETPEQKQSADRSGCLKIGAYLVLKKIISGRHLTEIADQIFGKNSGLFLDLAVYSIISENNAGQYYPDYAYNHPLFTEGMRVYSDSKVSDFIKSITRDQCIAFQNAWNSTHDHREKIYISYDSTNKNCQAGDIDLVEIGRLKDDQGKPVLNYSIAYGENNSEPLFYEEYPGSIVDVSQLQLMLEKARGYGYEHAGFILDRGYFSRENIRYMDKCGYDFIIMMKGMKSLAKELILQVKGTFEDKREYNIRDYGVNGKTVKGRLYASDERDRYFHIYYSDHRKAHERDAVEARINRISDFLQSHEGTRIDLSGSAFSKYFDLIYYHRGKSDECFEYGRERTDVVNREIELCGYFIIITSEKMNAEEALDLYKSRDASEKLFREDKAYLDNRSMRVSSEAALRSKILIEFTALIIRNRMHLLLKKRMVESSSKQNYFTVPAAVRELEKIEMIRQPDKNYRLDHAVTARQKDILRAFDMNEQNIRKQAIQINDQLAAVETSGKENLA